MEKKKKKSGAWSTALLVFILVIGLSLLLYPTVANYWNETYTTHAISSYAQTVQTLDKDQYAEMWAEARAFNELVTAGEMVAPTEEMMDRYERCLRIPGNDIMGYIEIPSIRLTLALKHTVDDMVLESAVGHLPWSNLPIGGEGTHCVLSGHRGLPSAKLFTDLDQVREGDIFILRVLDDVFTYEVDQIRIVEPDDLNELAIVDGEDYCTLVTCTPYGINSHRMLVRGHRTENAVLADSARVTADAIIVDPLVVAPVIAVPMLLILVIAAFIMGAFNRKPKSRED